MSNLKFTNKPIPERILWALSQGEVTPTEEGYHFDGMPQMEREDYDGFKKLLASMRGKWNRKTHVFPFNPQKAIDEILEMGTYPEINPDHYFPTPSELIEDIWAIGSLPDTRRFEISDLRPFRWLEPSAGEGSLVRMIREMDRNAEIDCFEIDPLNRLSLAEIGANVIGQNFLESEVEGGYDFVLMNPPFKGKEWLSHIKKAFSLLRPNGRLVAIVPKALLWDRQYRDLRNEVAKCGGWEELETDGFPIKTLCIWMDKLTGEEECFKPAYGYENYFVYGACIALDSDYDAMEALTKLRQPTLQSVLRVLNARVEHLIVKEGYKIVWDKLTQVCAANHFLEILREGYEVCERE